MITGGNGFVGSHLCDEFLKDDHQITILTRNKSNIANISHILDRITLEQVDVTEFANLGNSIEKNKPDVIIHLAGETSHSKSFENPLYDTDVNAKSTLFILEKIRTLNLKCRFILGRPITIKVLPKMNLHLRFRILIFSNINKPDVIIHLAEKHHTQNHLKIHCMIQT